MPGDKRSKSRRASDAKRARAKAKNTPQDEDEDLIDAGQGMELASHSSSDVVSRVGSKRKRDMAESRIGVQATDAGTFFDHLLTSLAEREDCSFFEKPVFEMWTKKDLPGYTDKIKTPMDFRTVRERLEGGFYAQSLDMSSAADGGAEKPLFVFDEVAIANDIRLIFTNAMLYNEKGSAIYATSRDVLKLVDGNIKARQQKLAKHAERAKRDADRKRRRHAEVQAAIASAAAFRTAQELKAARLKAEEAEKRRKDDVDRINAKWEAKFAQVQQQQNVQHAFGGAAAANGAAAPGATVPAPAVTAQNATANPALALPNGMPRPTAPGLGTPNVAVSAQLTMSPQHIVLSVVNGAPVQVAQPNGQQLQQHLQLQQQHGLVPGMVQPGMPQPSLVNGAMQSPGMAPGMAPGMVSSMAPSVVSSMAPSVVPSMAPSVVPSMAPSVVPSMPLGMPPGMPFPQPVMQIPKGMTISVSSDESDTALPEITFAFVSTTGMEKKRGRKSAQVMELEVKHDALMRRRRVLVDLTLELERSKKQLMSTTEKEELCAAIANLDFVQMKAVADIIAYGMNTPALLTEVEVEVDVNTLSNVVLREIQAFLKSPTCMTLKEDLRSIEAKIATIEGQLVNIRFQKVSS